MRAENAGKALGTVKGDPGKLPAVVVQEAGSETYAAPGGHVGERGIVVGTVEIVDPAGADQTVLHRLQRRGRTAADHQRAAKEILPCDEVFSGQRIIPPRDQIDAALKQLMDLDTRDLPHLLLEGKENIHFLPQKRINAVFILENRRDLGLWIFFRKQPHGLRQEVERLADHQADRDALPVFRAEILPLLDRALEFLPHPAQKANKLRPGGRQGRSPAAALKKRKADLLLQEPDLIGKGGLAHEQIVRRPAEVQGAGQFDAVIHLFGCHGVLSLFNN